MFHTTTVTNILGFNLLAKSRNQRQNTGSVFILHVCIHEVIFHTMLGMSGHNLEF